MASGGANSHALLRPISATSFRIQIQAANECEHPGLAFTYSIGFAATETGRVEFHIPVLHLDTEIQTNKGTGSRANREATTDRHGDGLLI